MLLNSMVPQLEPESEQVMLRATVWALVVPAPLLMMMVPVGAVKSAGAAVVKDHWYGTARPLPARSCAPFVMVAVYVVPVERADDGVNVAVAPLSTTLPATKPLGPLSIKVDESTIYMFSLKIAEIAEPTGAFIALPAGIVDITVGGVVSTFAVKFAVISIVVVTLETISGLVVVVTKPPVPVQFTKW